MSKAIVDSQFRWNIGELPFIWAPLKSPSGDGLPVVLPFQIEVSPLTGTLIQTPNTNVESALEKAYSLGSEMTGMMNDSGIGRRYADDFLSYLMRVRGKEDFSGCRVLEIGCGSGYLLSRIKELGGECIGIEPGSHGSEGASKYGVEVIRDFFPSGRIQGKFDLIIMYAVLEHIKEPYRFLQQVAKFAQSSAKIILAVPNCEPYISSGDISLFLHEHWSYFTPKTLIATLESAGLHSSSSEKAKFGGLLYAHASMGPSNAGTNLSSIIEEELRNAISFRAKATRNQNRLKSIVGHALQGNRSIGIFVPHRAANVLISTGLSAPFRLFDDNESLYGTYLPGLQNRIESRDDLLNTPPDIVLVFSNTFGEKIISELRDKVPDSTQLLGWNEIFQ